MGPRSSNNLTERRDGQTMLLAAQESPAAMEITERVSAWRSAPASFDMPPDRRQEILDLLAELSEKDVELVLNLVRRLQG